MGLDLKTEASRSHSDTPHSTGILWTSDRFTSETSTCTYLRYTQHSYETHIHGPGGFRTRNPHKRVAADWRHCYIIGCTVRDMTGGVCEVAGECTQNLTEYPEGKVYKCRLKYIIKMDRLTVGCKTS